MALAIVLMAYKVYINELSSSSPTKPMPEPTAVIASKTTIPTPQFTPRTSLQTFSEDLGNGVKLEIVLLPGGPFQMGSYDEEYADEEPVHQVVVPPFGIGKYEVTQAQWRAVMGGDNPSRFKGENLPHVTTAPLSGEKGENLPVEKVSWEDATEFCRKLSSRTGKTYRLPTEAEWEYACRGGTTTVFAFGASLSSTQANFDGNYPYGGAAKGVYRQKTTPVGGFPPNKFGLYDMHGNVWEWCQDWYDKSYYRQSPENNPQGPTSGTYRVVRGGSWYDYGLHCRSSLRNGISPIVHYDNIGFRVVLMERTQ